MLKITAVTCFLAMLGWLSSCKKDKLTTDPKARISLSEESVLFDTVFTTIGSSTRYIRIRNRNSQKIRISSIILKGGTSSQFLINVDGSKGVAFSNIDIAAHDSLYMFVQVNVNPTNANAPLIVEDEVVFTVNGNTEILKLEAWGQDAYYHRPTNAVKFKDGSYFAYSRISSTQNVDTVWKKDKPHVVYGYLVVDSAQKLTIQAGVQIYMNYKAGLWVFQNGQLQILGQKGNEVIIQGARRDKDYADDPGQWDRIWINEGSDQNIINYAIIKNGYIGIQAEVFGDTIGKPGKLKLTNTKIQNMSLWGLYCKAFKVFGGNNVISNCQEYCLNILLGGEYNFVHCTFANYWSKEKAREKTTINLNNYSDVGIYPDSVYFGNCIIDGKKDNEITLDLKTSNTAGFSPRYYFSNCWLKTNSAVTNTLVYQSVRSSTVSVNYKDPGSYNFIPLASETQLKFNTQRSRSEALLYKRDLNDNQRSNTIESGVTVGAYDPE